MTTNFDDLYDLYRDAIVRYCTWKCRDSEVGADLAQETFLRFWQCMQRQEKILHQRAYLYRIAHNLFLDHVRRKKEVSLDELLDVGFEPSVDPWQRTYNQLESERPLEKMKTMAGPQRKVLHQRFMMGLAPSEIAALTGETSNAVSVRIHRGLKDLRFLLKDDGHRNSYSIRRGTLKARA